MSRNAKYKLEPRYGTPPDYVEMARTALGGRIELDPMSEAIFNSVVGAERIWTAEDDCFRQDWTCETMLLNAAGGLVVRAWQRLVGQWIDGNVKRAIWVGFNLEQLAVLADHAMHPLDFSLLITRKRIDFLSAELQPITRQVSWIDEPIADLDAELRPAGSPSNANYVVGIGIDPGIFESAFAGRGRFHHGKHAVRSGMSITREDLVKIARTAVSGSNRPSAPCEGIKCRHNMECALNVTNPAAFDPPDWVVDAMRSAYTVGHRDGERYRQREIDRGRLTGPQDDDLPPDPVDSDAPRSSS